MTDSGNIPPFTSTGTSVPETSTSVSELVEDKKKLEIFSERIANAYEYLRDTSDSSKAEIRCEMLENTWKEYQCLYMNVIVKVYDNEKPDLKNQFASTEDMHIEGRLLCNKFKDMKCSLDVPTTSQNVPTTSQNVPTTSQNMHFNTNTKFKTTKVKRFKKNVKSSDNKVKCSECKGPTMKFTVKKNSPNKGRKFYKCRDGKCNFFKWADEEKPGHKRKCGICKQEGHIRTNCPIVKAILAFTK